VDPEPPARPPSQEGSPTEGAAVDEGVRRRQAREAQTAGTGPGSIWSDERADDEGDDPDATAGEPAEPPTPKSQVRNLIEWAGVIGGAILIAVVVRTFVFQTFWIPTPSMSPTLVKNDRVLVNKLSYRFHDPRRGDVVVFERPPNEPEGETKDLIKRVIGLPGERISIYDGKVHIDGRALDEPYTHGKPSLNPGECGNGEVDGLYTDEGLRIPDDTVFVMGDNRTDSHDGRCFGPIDQDLIVGRAFLIIWPPSKAGGL
jgi:signal peptidase I